MANTEGELRAVAPATVDNFKKSRRLTDMLYPLLILDWVEALAVLIFIVLPS